MKIQTTLLCGLLLSTPIFAAPINNKSSINQQVGYSFGYLMGRSNAAVSYTHLTLPTTPYV